MHQFHCDSDNVSAETDVTSASSQRNVVTSSQTGDVEKNAEDDAEMSMNRCRNIIEFEARDFRDIVAQIHVVFAALAECEQISEEERDRIQVELTLVNDSLISKHTPRQVQSTTHAADASSVARMSSCQLRPLASYPETREQTAQQVPATLERVTAQQVPATLERVTAQ